MKGKRPDNHELTRIEAYLLSEKAGHPSHMDEYFWAQAEAIVKQRAAIVAVAVKASTKKPAKKGKSVKAKPAAAKVKKTAAPAPMAAPTPPAPQTKAPAAKGTAPAKKVKPTKKAASKAK